MCQLSFSLSKATQRRNEGNLSEHHNDDELQKTPKGPQVKNNYLNYVTCSSHICNTATTATITTSSMAHFNSHAHHRLQLSSLWSLSSILCVPFQTILVLLPTPTTTTNTHSTCIVSFRWYTYPHLN